MTDNRIDIPPVWQRLPWPDLSGVLLVVGAANTGKSTFARYLFRRLSAEGRKVAFLDGDPGQSNLGPPATLTLALGVPGEDSFPPDGQILRRFVGAVSPRGHMLPVLVGAARLVEAAEEAGQEAVIYDTSGLIDPSLGGLALKQAKIDLLQPKVVFAIRGEKELDSLLAPLRRSQRTKVFEMQPSIAATRRDQASRQAHRADLYGAYFADAKPITFTWTQFAVFPGPRFSRNRLLALEDERGFMLGMGIILEEERQTKSLTLLTPITSLKDVDALRLGDIWLDSQTFRDQAIK